MSSQSDARATIFVDGSTRKSINLVRWRRVLAFCKVKSKTLAAVADWTSKCISKSEVLADLFVDRFGSVVSGKFLFKSLKWLQRSRKGVIEYESKTAIFVEN